jgi:hypothetical protein
MWFGPRHSYSEKQEGGQANTPNMGLFFRCCSSPSETADDGGRNSLPSARFLLEVTVNRSGQTRGIACGQKERRHE